mgnify:FL=1|jgi:hypothetical protein
MKQRNSNQAQQRNAQDLAAADDLAVAILQDRIEDAAARRQMNEQPERQLTAHDLARLGQQGALN